MTKNNQPFPIQLIPTVSQTMGALKGVVCCLTSPVGKDANDGLEKTLKHHDVLEKRYPNAFDPDVELQTFGGVKKHYIATLEVILEILKESMS